jgi:small-conductance mechanosensitive channel
MNIGESFQSATDAFFGFLPNVLGFLIILLIGYIIAKVVSAVVKKLLEKVGLDRQLHASDARKYVDRVMPDASPSGAIAKVVFWLIFVFFIFSAIGALRIPALTGFMNSVLAYLPNVIVAILIFVVAALISGAVAAGVTRIMGDTPTGKIVASVAPAVIMIIAMFMILEQLQIAPEIVRIAFAAIMFALALGLALAFGLGGRGVAERLLEDGYRKGLEHKEQARADFATGAQRTQDQFGQSQYADQGQYTQGQHTQGDSAFDQQGGYSGTGGYDAGTTTSYDDPGTGTPGYQDPNRY